MILSQNKLSQFIFGCLYKELNERPFLTRLQGFEHGLLQHGEDGGPGFVHQTLEQALDRSISHKTRSVSKKK